MAVKISGDTIGHSNDTNLITLADQSVTIASDAALTTGDLHVSGNLFITKAINSTTISEQTLEITDKLIIVASGSSAGNAINGAGLQIGSNDKDQDLVASFLYDNTLNGNNGGFDVNVDAATVASVSALGWTVAGTVNGDDADARTLFASMSTADNGLTLGGGADVIAGGDVQLAAAGKINDAGGHARFTAADAGATILGAADGTAGLTLAADNSDVTVAGDLVVSGGKITLTNGSLIDSETSNELQLTEDLVVVTGDLKVEGEGIQAADGNERISLADAMVLKDATANAVVTLHASDLSTTFAGDVNIQGTTPILKIGDGGQEDMGIEFDGNAVDYFIKHDDSVDGLVFGTQALGALNPGSAGDAFIITSGSTSQAMTTFTSYTKFNDNKVSYYGTGNDYIFGYNSTADALIQRAEEANQDFKLIQASDVGADAGDSWLTTIAADDGGKISWGNDINSKGTHVTHFGVVPAASVGDSYMNISGNIRLGDGALIGSDAGHNTDYMELFKTGAGNAALIVKPDVDSSAAGNGALVVSGGLGVVKKAYVGTDLHVGGDAYVSDDLLLNSDSAVLSMGAGADVTLTHDGSTGGSLKAAGTLVLDSVAGDINLSDNGTAQLAFDLDGTAGEVIVQLKVDSDDLVFKQYDGTEVLRLDDDGSVYVKDNLSLKSDAAVLKFGADEDTTLTHTDGTGLTMNSTNKLCFNSANNFVHGSDADSLLVNGATDVLLHQGGNLIATVDANGLTMVDDATKGQIIANGYTTRSDREIKKDIKSIDNSTALSKVMSIDSVEYVMIKGDGRKELGFIAQDVAKVVPEICALDARGHGRGIDYSKMSTLLVGAVKQQQTQIEELKALIAKLAK